MLLSRKSCPCLRSHTMVPKRSECNAQQSSLLFVTKPYQEKSSLDNSCSAPGILTHHIPLREVFSGLHRISGVALYTGYSAVMASSLLSTETVPFMIDKIPISLKFPVKFCVSAALSYHWISGLRHILWDTNLLRMSTKRINQSMIALASTTAAFTTAFTLGSTIKKLFNTANSDIIAQNASFLRQVLDT